MLGYNAMMYKTEWFAFTIQDGIQCSNIKCLTMIIDTALIENSSERLCWQFNRRLQVLHIALCSQYQRAQHDRAMNGSQWCPSLKFTWDLKTIAQFKHWISCRQVKTDFSEWCRHKEKVWRMLTQDFCVQRFRETMQHSAVHTHLKKNQFKVTTLYASHKANLCIRDCFQKLFNLGQSSDAQIGAESICNTLKVINKLLIQSMSASSASWWSGAPIPSSVVSPSAAFGSTPAFAELAGTSAIAIHGHSPEAVAVDANVVGGGCSQSRSIKGSASSGAHKPVLFKTVNAST